MSEGKWWPFGIHRTMERSIEEVILRYPDYITWWNQQDRYPGFEWLDEYIAKRIGVFDRKPFNNAKCAGKVNGLPCTRPVTLATCYATHSMPAFWCDECDPTQLGATVAKLTTVRTYNEALTHARCCNGPMTAQRDIIKNMAIAKGLKKPFTEKKIFRFLHGLTLE